MLGIDVQGYTHNINSDGIRHILKRHGEKGQQDNTMSNVDDVARIGWVINNYDAVELIIEDGKQSYSTGFANKNNSPAPQIRYSKKINGTYYVVEAIFENKNNKLWVQSAYLSKNREDVTQVPDAADKPPEVTAKTDLPSPSSKFSLSQDVKKVNNDYISKEASSQEENASFFDYNLEKTTPKINPDEVISGIWEDSPKRDKNIVEKSQLESVENVGDNWYNDNNIITDGSHLVNDKLKPNVKYKSGEYDYIYATDQSGRIVDLHTDELQYTERDERLKHNANSLGKEIGDHAGHLIGDRYGGSPDIDNIVSQSGLVNLSEYKKIENIWARALDSGQKVGVDIKVQYEGNSMRPSSFIVNYTIDGIKTQTTIEN